jgi:thymidylate synthase
MSYVNVVCDCDSVTQAFDWWYDKLINANDLQASRDGTVCGEVINAITVISDPTQNICKSEIRKLSMRYAVGEFLWYLSGNNHLSEIQKYTGNWDRMSDDGVTVNSNYGHCIKYKYGFDQLEYVEKMLTKNPQSRQAVIHIKEPSFEPSKDVNCTVCLQFFIRDDKLYMTTYMRSNDIWLGFPYDVFQFCNLQILLSMKLGVKLGSYTHIAGSLHLYERDVKKE